MIALCLLLVLLLLTLLGVLAYAGHQIETLHRRIEAQENSRHESAMIGLQRLASATLLAAKIRNLADLYDTVEAKADMRRIANTTRADDLGPSIPALWLLEQADKIDPEPERGEVRLYRFDGSAVQ